MKAKTGKIDITAETTLNELMQYCTHKNTKARKRPGVVQLRKIARCVASFADDKLSYKIAVYDNGYATYETFNRGTVVNLYEAVSSVTPTEDSTVIDGEYSYDWGKMPWKTAITLLGEDQIAQNMFKHLSVSGRTKNQRNLDINDETDNVDDVNNVESLNNNDVNRQAALHAHIPDSETAYIRKESRKELSSAISKADSELTKKQRDVYVLEPVQYLIEMYYNSF